MINVSCKCIKCKGFVLCLRVMWVMLWVIYCMNCDVIVCAFLFLFSIGLLILAKALDRETVDQYRLIVTASDGHPGGVKHQPSHNLRNLLECDKQLIRFCFTLGLHTHLLCTNHCLYTTPDMNLLHKQFIYIKPCIYIIS